MNAVATSLTILAMVAMSLPAATAAPVHEYWVGSYDMHIDSGRGTLRISYSQAHCGTVAACMEILYYSASGEKAYGQVEQIDPDGHHMVFRIPSRALRFDSYLFRSDNATIVGTVEWGGNAQGFYGMKEGKARATAAGPERRVQSDGSILVSYPDGRKQNSRAVSGPPRPSSGRVRGEEEVGTAQANVQPLSLPDPLPGSESEVWLKSVNQNLLSAIQGLLGMNETSIQNYLQGEGAQVRSEYGRAYYRTDFIRRWWGF